MNDTQPAPAALGASHPRALLFFLSHQDTYRTPLFSKNEIFCGPDTEARAKNKRVTAIRTTAGSFDVTEVLKQIPAEQQPEVVVVKADATRRNMPRNLAAVKAPKVLLVGDTHHMRQPIETLIRYAQSEPFDFVIFDHTRHHARFFAEAGVRNLFWLPALDYGFLPRPLVARPSRPLTFVGQAGKHHPYRCAVLDHVRNAGLPLQVLQAPLAETANIYADSQVTLNVSLNGDLNLRVFEALSAGGFLLTDELTADSGLARLFTAGEHLDTWRTPGELVEKIQHYLAHPEEAQRIRAAGQAELHRNHSPSVKLKEFYDLVGSGKVNPKYDFKDEPWYQPRATASFAAIAGRIAAHEAVQELHRSAEIVSLENLPSAAQSDYAGLPRVQFGTVTTEPIAGAHHRVLCWHDGLSDETIAAYSGNHHLCVSDDPAVQQRMLAWGLEPLADGARLYRVAHTGLWLDRLWSLGDRERVRSQLDWALAKARTADDCLAITQFAEQLGEGQALCSALETAVALDRSNHTALLTHAALLLDHGEPEGVTLMLEEAARLQPLPADVESLRSRLVAEFAEHESLTHYFRVTGRTPVEQTDSPMTVLVVTNLLPPQELGGYGRSMWEFAHGLKARGHKVRILAANAPEFAKPPTSDEVEMEKCVSRTLEMAGTWKQGRAVLIDDRNEILRRVRDNTARVRTAINKQKPDLVLAGNLDLLGIGILRPAFEAEIPVIHSVGNAQPGYAVAEQPTVGHYCVAPCSDWAGNAFRDAGFSVARVETLYPGARVDRFFRFFLPDTKWLRICYASLVLPFKGVHTLVGALAQLHRAGVDFTAEIAGDAPDTDFLAQLQAIVRDNGMESKVRFTGFLDRDGLAALFARSNVLVFPSLFQEPFGISQVEALASGLVVVTSGTGGAKEIIRDGVDGLHFTAGDIGDLTAKLTQLSNDPDLMAQLQRSAQSRAVTFSVNESVRKIESVAAEMKAAIQASHLEELPIG